MRTDDAAPTGLEFILVLGSTNMPRLTALNVVSGSTAGCKVRSQIPNKTYFVTDRDDGQKANSLSSCTRYGITRTLIPQKFVWHETGGIDQFDGGMGIPKNFDRIVHYFSQLL